MFAISSRLQITTAAFAAVSALFFVTTSPTTTHAQSVNVWAAGQAAFNDCMSGAQTPGKRDYCAWRRCLAEMAHTPAGSDPAALAGAGPCLPLLKAFQQSHAPDTTPSDLVDVPGAAPPSKSPPNRPLGSWSGGNFTPYVPSYGPSYGPSYVPSEGRPPVIIIRGPGVRGPGIRNPGWNQPQAGGPGPSMGNGCHKNPVTGAPHCGKENSPFAKTFNPLQNRNAFVNRNAFANRNVFVNRNAFANRGMRGASPMFGMSRSSYAGRSFAMRRR